MTKKSNARKLRDQGMAAPSPQRYRRLDLDIPMELYHRAEKALGAIVEKGLLPPSTTPRDFILATVFVNGLAMVEADLHQRERQGSLVVTPQEAAEMAGRLRKAKLGAH